MLKQSEIFAFISIFFLVLIFLVEGARADDRETAARIPALEAAVAKANSRAEKAEKELVLEQKKNPPIVILSEENAAYRFPLSRATPTDDFRAALNDYIIPLLDSIAADCQCNGIEVIGHTDALPVSSRGSDLDTHVIGFLDAHQADALSPGSNVDLGMMRALAVMDILRDARDHGWFKGVRYFLPYSAGQLIESDRTLVQRDDRTIDQQRRRIEIRLLRVESRMIK